MSEQDAYQIALKAYANSIHNRAYIAALGLTLLSDNQISKFEENFNDCLKDIVKSEVELTGNDFLASLLKTPNDFAR